MDRKNRNLEWRHNIPGIQILRSVLLILTLANLSTQIQAAEPKVWKTSSFLDFVDGTFSDSSNSYVTADGQLVLINRLDLNGDGSADVVLPNDHDPNQRADLFIYWGGDSFSSKRRLQLPTNGGSDSVVADLNRDGHPELIVANNFNGTRTDLDSYIYWGSARGFDASRRSGLPTLGARAVAVEDLNRDGHPDLVFANSGLGYHVTVDRANQSYVYWGSAEGYSADRRLVLKTINCRDVAVKDLDGDGHPELIFANEGNTDEEGGVLIYWGSRSGDYSQRPATHLPGERSSAVAVADLNGDGVPEIVLANAYRLRTRELGMYNIVDTVSVNSYVYWGSKQGYSALARTSLPTLEASDVAVGDLNRDGWPDLVFANKSGSASYIYWGSADGYRPQRRTALPTRHPTRQIVEDLDGDGYLDLVFAQTHAELHKKPRAYLYWGSENGFAADRRLDLPTLEASGVQAADLNGDGHCDLVFVNAADESSPIPAYIYWGDLKEGFNAERRQVLPSGGSFYAGADVNRDGHMDLVFASIHDKENGPGIYWGGPKGYSPINRSLLDGHGAFCSRVADFNRDGYLDVSLSQWKAGEKATSLYWGGPSGFSGNNRFVFRIGSIRRHSIADFNRDGWLDIVFSTTDNKIVLYWNSPLGFDNQRKTVLPSRVSVGVEVADLNRDGQLDLIVSNLFDAKPAPDKPQSFGGSPQGDTFIYWGSPQGYDASRREILPSVGNADVAVADLNRDGLLDLVLSSYHAGHTRSHPSTIYWNGESGFDSSRTTRLPTNSASGVLVNDFNQDGYPDIFFACHSKKGNHRNNSFLYWGSGNGYSKNRRSLLPGIGPHSLTSDSGHVYDRGDRYDYVSPPFDAGLEARFESIRWEGATPFRTSLEFQVRSARSRQGLESTPWRGPEGATSFYTKPGVRLSEIEAGNRWIQYKATLISPNSANSPVLNSVSISYR
jgi:hypothetical protein